MYLFRNVHPLGKLGGVYQEDVTSSWPKSWVWAIGSSSAPPTRGMCVLPTFPNSWSRFQGCSFESTVCCWHIWIACATEPRDGLLWTHKILGGRSGDADSPCLRAQRPVCSPAELNLEFVSFTYRDKTACRQVKGLAPEPKKSLSLEISGNFCHCWDCAKGLTYQGVPGGSGQTQTDYQSLESFVPAFSPSLFSSHSLCVNLASSSNADLELKL